MKSLIILPAKRCKRSQNLLEYLQSNHIPFQRIEPDSPEGEEMIKKYQFLASPGILIDGMSINPFDVLISPACKVNEQKITQLLNIDGD